MKYDKYLKEHIIPEFSGYYLDYSKLKRAILQHQRTGDQNAFTSLLSKELEKVNNFFCEQLEQLQQLHSVVCSGYVKQDYGSFTEGSEDAQRFHQVSLQKFKQFLSQEDQSLLQQLNYTGPYRTENVIETIHKIEKLGSSLLCFVALNYTAVVKILKKNDKLTESNLKDQWLKNVQAMTFASSHIPEEILLDSQKIGNEIAEQSQAVSELSTNPARRRKYRRLRFVFVIYLMCNFFWMVANNICKFLVPLVFLEIGGPALTMFVYGCVGIIFSPTISSRLTNFPEGRRHPSSWITQKMISGDRCLLFPLKLLLFLMNVARCTFLTLFALGYMSSDYFAWQILFISLLLLHLADWCTCVIIDSIRKDIVPVIFEDDSRLFGYLTSRFLVLLELSALLGPLFLGFAFTFSWPISHALWLPVGFAGVNVIIDLAIPNPNWNRLSFVSLHQQLQLNSLFGTGENVPKPTSNTAHKQNTERVRFIGPGGHWWNITDWNCIRICIKLWRRKRVELFLILCLILCSQFCLLRILLPQLVAAEILEDISVAAWLFVAFGVGQALGRSIQEVFPNVLSLSKCLILASFWLLLLSFSWFPWIFYGEATILLRARWWTDLFSVLMIVGLGFWLFDMYTISSFISERRSTAASSPTGSTTKQPINDVTAFPQFFANLIGAVVLFIIGILFLFVSVSFVFIGISVWLGITSFLMLWLAYVLKNYHKYLWQPLIDPINSNSNRGCLFIFEGIYGAGKTTQVRAIKKELQEEGYIVVSHSFSSIPCIHKNLLKFLLQTKPVRTLAIHVLMSLQFEAFLHRILVPGIEHNKFVFLCDGFLSLPIAIGAAQGFDRQWLKNLHASSALEKLKETQPLSVYLRIDAQTSVQRLLSRSPAERTLAKTDYKNAKKRILLHKPSDPTDPTVTLEHFSSHAIPNISNSQNQGGRVKQLSQRNLNLFDLFTSFQAKVSHEMDRLFEKETLTQRLSSNDQRRHIGGWAAVNKGGITGHFTIVDATLSREEQALHSLQIVKEKLAMEKIPQCQNNLFDIIPVYPSRSSGQLGNFGSAGDVWGMQVNRHEGLHRYFRKVIGSMKRRLQILFDTSNLPRVCLHGNPHLDNYRKTVKGWTLVGIDRSTNGPYLWDLARFMVSVLVKEEESTSGFNAGWLKLRHIRKGYISALSAPNETRAYEQPVTLSNKPEVIKEEAEEEESVTSIVTPQRLGQGEGKVMQEMRKFITSGYPSRYRSEVRRNSAQTKIELPDDRKAVSGIDNAEMHFLLQAYLAMIEEDDLLCRYDVSRANAFLQFIGDDNQTKRVLVLLRSQQPVMPLPQPVMPQKNLKYDNEDSDGETPYASDEQEYTTDQDQDAQSEGTESTDSGIPTEKNARFVLLHFKPYMTQEVKRETSLMHSQSNKTLDQPIYQQANKQANELVIQQLNQQLRQGWRLYAPGLQHRIGCFFWQGILYLGRQLRSKEGKLNWNNLSEQQKKEVLFAIGSQLGRAHANSLRDHSAQEEIIRHLKKNWPILQSKCILMKEEITCAYYRYLSKLKSLSSNYYL